MKWDNTDDDFLNNADAYKVVSMLLMMIIEGGGGGEALEPDACQPLIEWLRLPSPTWYNSLVRDVFVFV